MNQIKKIAIQGAKGSFHEQAAMKYFTNNIECVECRTFNDLFNLIDDNLVDYAVAAIENTVAGTILPNYAMLRESDARIIGEVYLPIQQNLMALPGQSLNDIKEVHSHPMAILQCQIFFDKHPHIRLVTADDTAAQAKWIAENQLTHIGAIAGSHVAKMYNLNLLAEGIETDKKNFTRFLVLKRFNGSDYRNTKSDKASACFIVKHEKGSLARVLTLFAGYDINLTKIQSLPILGKEWEYYIHVDMEFENYDKYIEVLNVIRPLLTEFKILGEYKRGNKIVL